MTIEIPLTRGYVAIVDDCDADLAQYRWHATRDNIHVYAARNVKVGSRFRYVLMHRVILERTIGRPLTAHEQVDHVDGNALFNSRDNLRIASRAENCRNATKRKDNTSGFKGVIFHKHTKKYYAQIRVNGHRIRSKGFTSPEQAYEAYIANAVKYHGQFANDGVRSLKDES
jgi:hypothetical protein